MCFGKSIVLKDWSHFWNKNQSKCRLQLQSSKLENHRFKVYRGIHEHRRHQPRPKL
jgi:hypothetical protein